MTTPNVQQVPLHSILTPVQIRPIDQAHVERLAESMKTHGLEVPIVVHEKPASKDFDLGPGRHRLEAAALLGWDHIPAIVKPPASAAEIRAEQARENLERADLTPLQEAELVETVLQDCEGNTAEAAARLGRSAKWVELRAALQRLHPKVREYVADGSLPLSHAQLIARVADQEAQVSIAKYVRAGAVGERPSTLSECARQVENEGRNLASVNWRLDVPFGTVQPTVACSGCPHNSANRGDLFAEGEAPKKPTCLLRDCYTERTTLSSLGARKVANYLVKEGLKPTPANIEAAIQARAVPFVAPSAPKHYVGSSLAKPKDSKAGKGKAAKAEKPEQPKGPTPQDKLRDAERDWKHERVAAIQRATKGKPLTCALLDMIGQVKGSTQGYYGGGKLDSKVVAALKPIAAKASNVTSDTLLAVAKLADARDGARLEYGLAEELFEAIVTSLDVKLKPRPTLDQFKPKAEAKPAATPTKKPAKKAGRK